MKKLKIELVPESCWYFNLRSILSKNAWDFIKKDAKIRSGGKCAVCGRETGRLEAHEVWEYDTKTQTQKLIDVISVCHDCHSAIHIERTALKGDVNRAEDHYMKVNGCSYSQMKKDRSEANIRNRELNKITDWKLDVTWLKRFTQ